MSMRKKFLITAGGTGGHIFPAQGLAQQLARQSASHEVLFVAGGLSSNRYFDRSLFPFKEVACSPLLSRNPLKSLKGCLNMGRGFYQSLRILKEYQPDVVVGFGSYYTVPTLLAAKWLKIPIILHEANSIPGKANKWFAPYAQYIGVHFPYTQRLLKGKTVEVGMPLREGYCHSILSKEAARDYFQLNQEIPVLLVFGGSQGARTINQLMQACLRDGFHSTFQVIHLTGDETIIQSLIKQYKANGIKASVKAFETNMNRAWKAADVFVGRSGASTIAEAMEFEVPGILIPYPAATDNHQEKNADFLIETVKGGIKILEKTLTPMRFKEELNYLLDAVNLDRMRQCIYHYKQQPNRMDLCKLVLTYL
jgi:UDP-N-acetylglucosamine--N-acetylmuramyl-(pentapeptide) pyrophosphoryl-undecaprenol N-acetylglucosamine transferase